MLKSATRTRANLMETFARWKSTAGRCLWTGSVTKSATWTPLFLAALERSCEACKSLMDNFANWDTTDHMDRLPRDVSSERIHTDIMATKVYKQKKCPR